MPYKGGKLKPTTNEGKESPCRNELLEYVDLLQDSEKELIKTIQLDNLNYLLSLDHVQFSDLIAKSLSLEQLGKLSAKQLVIRGRIINEIKKIRARLIIKKWGEREEQRQRQRQENSKKQSQEQLSNKLGMIEEVAESIMGSYKLITLEESRDILYYSNGVYVPGGDILIEKEAENTCGYKLSNKDLTEIKGHITRKTYHKRIEMDADVNIINLKNGLYNLRTGQFKEHTPDYLSVNQKPLIYDPNAKPKLFGKYLQQVLYPAETRTAVELMAYTFYRDNPFELYCILLGIGANGKSVFTSLLSALHGLQNVSNVPLASLLDNRFALADLENKDINIDTELSSVVIKDIAILKKLTGRQPIRIERKNQHAYDSSLHAKLLFIANKIPDTNDNSDAHYRREIIISFPNQFEGDKSDVNLIDKLTAAEELSGIFNILMPALRRILHTGRIGINQKTIQERRERHELITNPITAFIKNTVDEFSVESDHVTKEDFYRAYKNFCKYHNLPVEQIETFGKIIKKKHNFKEGRVNR